MAAFVAVAAEDRLVHRSSPDRATPQWGALDLEGTWTCIAEDERLRLRTQRPINGTMQDLNDLHYFVRVVDHGGFAPAARSEEHTSELQSLMRISYAVFCLK